MSRRTETAYKTELQGESAQHDEAHLERLGDGKCGGCVGKEHVLTRGYLPNFATKTG